MHRMTHDIVHAECAIHAQTIAIHIICVSSYALIE